VFRDCRSRTCRLFLLRFRRHWWAAKQRACVRRADANTYVHRRAGKPALWARRPAGVWSEEPHSRPWCHDSVQPPMNKGSTVLNERAKGPTVRTDEDFWTSPTSQQGACLTSQSFGLSGRAAIHGSLRRCGARRPRWAANQPVDTAPANGPLVPGRHVRDGFSDQAGCLAAGSSMHCGLCPLRGIVTTGQAIDPGMWRPSHNVTVVAAAPHSEVPKHTKVVVTHGGHGHRCPRPSRRRANSSTATGRDQPTTQHASTARGAGVTLKSTAAPEKIAAAVRMVFSTIPASE